MKKNFYFQHSLMSMFDPRMKHLVDNEGLRGLGAYWIIIEKLSILPEPRAQLDYLRAYCDSKKITLCYLKKIILEYDLFELDEDGYFMYNPQNEMFRLLGTKRSFSQNETFFFSHLCPPTLPFSA